MKRIRIFIFLLIGFSFACNQISSPVPSPTDSILPPSITEIPPLPIVENTAPAAPSALPNSALVDFYDPARNPADDLSQAMVIAQKENKNIMLELGGDWCIWCKYMDDFYATHADILQVRAENYVLVKINVSSENENAVFLAQFPEVTGYPHIFILDSGGNLIHSQDTALLEQGNSYNPDVFMAFLNEWSPASK